VKWVVDPGLDGDVYADKPYLYGPMGSSVNTLFVGGKNGSGKSSGASTPKSNGSMEMDVREGGSSDGVEYREEKGMPDTEAARKKWFLTEANRKEWEWEAGREYGCDFFNPYLDFNGMSIYPYAEPVFSPSSANNLRFRPPSPGLHSPHHEILGWSRSSV
jgi:hypothetical protein